MPSHAWTLLLALCASGPVYAAPVPPARLVTAETVVKPLQGGPRDLATRLLSAPLTGAAARSRAAVALGCLSGEKNPSAWLAARLRVTVDEVRGTVTIRLVDCPRRDAVALLSAVVEAYKADALGRGRASINARYEQALVFQALVGIQQGNGGPVPINVTFEMVGEAAGVSRAEMDRSVIQAPKILQASVPGRGGSAPSSSR
jgi:hypothetical protein